MLILFSAFSTFRINPSLSSTFAISILNLEKGTRTSGFLAMYPFLIVTNMSATGSIFFYQDDFFNPGISPLWARDLKHIRHTPNFLKYALGRPQIKHLFVCLLLYFNFPSFFTIFDVLAIINFL